jgi:hypothetical protein
MKQSVEEQNLKKKIVSSISNYICKEINCYQSLESLDSNYFIFSTSNLEIESIFFIFRFLFACRKTMITDFCPEYIHFHINVF